MTTGGSPSTIQSPLSAYRLGAISLQFHTHHHLRTGEAHTSPSAHFVRPAAVSAKGGQEKPGDCYGPARTGQTTSVMSPCPVMTVAYAGHIPGGRSPSDALMMSCMLMYTRKAPLHRRSFTSSRSHLRGHSKMDGPVPAGRRFDTYEMAIRSTRMTWIYFRNSQA